MKKFEFMTATKVLYEENGLANIAIHAKGYGKKAMIVTGKRTTQGEEIKRQLEKVGLQGFLFQVISEPSLEEMEEGILEYRKEEADFVIACGGGSVLDAGKTLAAMANNEGTLLSYLEVIGEGKALLHPSCPMIAIPTTAGTGAEVTKNAVISSPVHGVKVSLRSPYMLPELVLLDPRLTLSMPKEVTASTGLDALTQVIEPFVSHMANPITDAFCREGMRLCSHSLREAFDHGENLNAREDMLLASLFGGMALANAKLGVVHGFAGVIGGMYGIPHGVVCAGLLPHSIVTNVEALKERGDDPTVLKRYEEVAQILTGDTHATIDQGMAWIMDLSSHLSIPKFSSYGIDEKDYDLIVEKAMKASSMKGNPIELTKEELRTLLKKACE